MEPIGSATGSPAPIAAAMGSSISHTLLPPALNPAARIARRSTEVAPEGMQMTISGPRDILERLPPALSHASDSSEDLPVADLSDPISKQLAEVPRCVSTAGDILFFHRVVPFLGPEYAPGLEYGLYAEGYALMVSDFHASLRGLPIRVDPAAKRETAIIWIDGTRFGH